MLRRILSVILVLGMLSACLLLAGATESAEPEWPYSLYFGLLHAHTDLSDGTGTVEEAFAHASQVEGLDFFAVTDHSNSFDNDTQGGISLEGTSVSTKWAAGKTAAAGVTDDDFLGIFGYEMTWQEGKHLGHISTFNTPGWESVNHSAYDNPSSALETYYKALATVPGSVSQFNHPGSFYGNFEEFGHYDRDYDDVIHLLEVGGEGAFTAYDAYTKALDAGWHVAPSTSQNNHNGLWGDADDKRTVVLAEALTEERLFEAIRSYRVYATEDRDLEIRYALDGAVMGSTISANGDFLAEICLNDPTDAVPGKMEVITRGGETVASCEDMENGEPLYLSVPGGYPYYYLRITQADGDVAITAPVWAEEYEDLGISRFEPEDPLPVAGEEVKLAVHIYNEESQDLVIHSAQLLLEGNAVCTLENPGTVKAGETLTLSLPYTHAAAGVADLVLQVTGTVAGDTRIWEETLTLRFRSGESVSGLLVDGSHGNKDLDQLSNFKALAERADLDVTVVTEEMPRGGEVLLVTAPAEAFEEEFVLCVEEFLKQGGSLMVTGSAGGSPQLNRLLEECGSTVRLNPDLATDDVNNGGTPDVLSAVTFNPDSRWCARLMEGQVYSHRSGCTLNPGSGTWLVKNGTDVLMACEETAWGGWIFAAGGSFVSDEEMPAPQNRWELPSANRTLAETILGEEQTVFPLSEIKTVRHGEDGEIFRIIGYVTAGTEKKHNSFPKTLYLQDDTGGIAVTEFTDTGIRVGAPVELIGRLHWNVAVPELQLIDYRLLQEEDHKYDPRTMANKTAMDYETHGGELLKIQGKVTELKKTEDGKGIVRLVLKDTRGHEAVVEIEEGILSGKTGKNTLAKNIKIGSTVRVIGLLHMNKEGETVLRVRNCDEVVYIPAEKDPTNPQSGDWMARIQKALQFS